MWAFLLPANYSKRPWANAIGTENKARKHIGCVENPEIWGFNLLRLGRILNYLFIYSFYILIMSTKVATKTTKKVSIHSTAYGQKVLKSNAGLKAEFSSTGGAMKFILALGKNAVPSNYMTAIRKIQKDDNLYKAFDEVVRTSRKGKTLKASPFRVLQALYAQLDKK